MTSVDDSYIIDDLELDFEDDDWDTEDEEDDELFLDELSETERREIIEGYVTSRTGEKNFDLPYDYSVDDYPYGYGVD